MLCNVKYKIMLFNIHKQVLNKFLISKFWYLQSSGHRTQLSFWVLWFFDDFFYDIAIFAEFFLVLRCSELPQMWSSVRLDGQV